MLAGIPSFAGTTEKARILSELSATPSRCAARAKSNPKDSAELALDLIVYRWASSLGKEMPTGVANINEVISGLASALNDPVINWARTAFSATPGAGTSAALPPSDDPRSEPLTEISRQFGMGLEWRESSPVQSVAALVIVQDACQKLQIDLTGALVRAVLGSQYHNDMARYRDAELCYGPASSIFSQYGCLEAAAVVYDHYAALGMDMSRARAAAPNYKFAAYQWQLLAKQHPGVSRYQEMTGTEYIKAGQAQTAAGDPDTGLILMNDGLRYLTTAAGMTKSYDTLIANVITVADAYAKRGDFSTALSKLEFAAKACRNDTDPLLAARVYEERYAYSKALNLTSAADQELNKRDKLLQNAAQAGEMALLRLGSSEPMTRDAQAKLYLSAEQGAAAFQALKNYLRAESLLRRLLAIYERSAMTDKQIDCLRSLAAVMDLQNNPQESLKLRLEAANLAMTANKPVIAAQIVGDMYHAFVEIGDLENTIDTLNTLASIIDQSGNVRGTADVLECRGTLLASHGRYEDAVKDFQDALKKYSEQVGDPWAAAAVSLHLASALNTLKRPAESCTVLESALRRIERRYTDENVDPAGDPEHSGRVMSLYRELATSYVHDGKPDDAESLLTKGRRYLWIGELVTQLKTSDDPDLAKFAATVDILNGTTGNPASDTPRANTLLAKNWAEFYAQCRLLSVQHATRYNALPISPLEVYKSRNDLPRKTLVIEYMTTSSSTYAFVCGNGKASVWELGVSSRDLTPLVAALRERIKSCEDSLAAGIPLPRINDWREPTYLEIREPLVSLYSALLAPIAGDLASYQLLMFALPDTLDGVPMHALISSEKDGAPRFVIQDFEVGYLRDFMLADLIGRDSRSIDPGIDRLAVFADPAGNLRGAREEATALRKSGFDSALSYVGKDATVPNFVRECNKAGILHIALHYNVDPDPTKFVLQLAPDGDSDGGQITVHELTAITNPHLQLVVLSACESAASTDPLQSGPSCAAEVFSLAGAKSVMGGLWKVSDAASLKLMEDFYRALVHKRSRGNSLQHAQTADDPGQGIRPPVLLGLLRAIWQPLVGPSPCAVSGFRV